MDVVFALVIMCSVIAILGIYRATMNQREDRKATIREGPRQLGDQTAADGKMGIPALES